MEEMVIVIAIVLGIPWMLMHYITKWKTAPKLTDGDEAMLEELYQLARRLDERMDTVERLVAHDSPDFEPARRIGDRDADDSLNELDRLMKERTTR